LLIGLAGQYYSVYKTTFFHQLLSNPTLSAHFIRYEGVPLHSATTLRL